MKNKIIQILVSLILFIFALLFKFNNPLINQIIFIASYIIIGLEVIIKSIKNICAGEIFDENFLMMIATIGAIIIGEYSEAVAVMLFYQIGESLQDYAVDKSKKSITELMDLKVEFANIKKGNKIIKTNHLNVKINDVIVVKPGEKIPLDGVIIESNSMVDTTNLTGEAIPKEALVNDEVLSGCINMSSPLYIKVTREYKDSTVSKILDLVENAENKKSKSENFISKFAKYYTPIVVLLAILLVIIPTFIFNQDLSLWLYRALTFLVVSCPCALVISIPLSFFSGIGACSKNGILVKGGNYLEALSKTKTIVFDKTGTLTKGVFEVQKIIPIDISKEELLEVVAHAEGFSNHPISLSIQKAYSKKIDNSLVKNVEEIPGLGVIATIDGKEVIIGNDKLMKENKIEFKKSNDIGTILYVAINKKYSGYILISDEIKHDSKILVNELKKLDVKRVVMITGDKYSVANKIAKILNINYVYSNLLPHEKREKVEELMKEVNNNTLAFVGDGINDAPSLALSDVGISMGGVGSDAAIEASDIVIMNDELSKIKTAIKISKKTLKIVKENITIVLIVKIAVLILSALGLSSMWHAVFADVGISLIAILNSLRIFKNKNI